MTEKWLRQGDYNRKLPSAGAVKKRLGYLNQKENAKILYFNLENRENDESLNELGWWTQEGTHTVATILFKDPNVCEEFKEAYTKNLLYGEFHHIYPLKERGMCIIKMIDNVEDIKRVILAIHQADPFHKEDKQYFSSLFNIQIPVTREEILERIEDAPNDNNFNLESVLSEARQLEDPTLFYDMGLIFEKYSDSASAIICYREIKYTADLYLYYQAAIRIEAIEKKQGASALGMFAAKPEVEVKDERDDHKPSSSPNLC